MGKKPWVMGIASSHNGGACLLHGNRIVVAIQEERLVRVKRAKHPGAFPSLAIQYCLDSANICADQLDAIVLCASSQARRPREDTRLNPQFKSDRTDVAFLTLPHHLGHAIGVYVMAGCPKEAAVLVIDGRGSPWDELFPEEQKVIPRDQFVREMGPGREMPREVISTYLFREGSYVPLDKHISSYKLPRVRIPGIDVFTSLGDMYGAVGEQIFGSHMDGPGKVMGLAPYGVPRIPVSNFYRIIDDQFEFQDVLGERFNHNERWPNRSAEYMDLAASVQLALENAVLHLCKKLKVRTTSDVLCYAGGVALNSVANERIVNEAGFENVFMMPASEDSGTAIGAAFYGLWQLDGYSKHPQQQTDSVGHVYPPEEIHAALRCFPEVKIIKSDDILGSVCELLAQGKTVGWHDNGSELGPRALGQRSILSDPRSASAKEFINSKIKFREEFRPFAPMITEEDVQDWFETTDRHCTSPFMLRVLRFRAEKAHQVAAVVHVDGTGRVQTVSKSFSPKLHALLTQWKARTGIPILLNTSFNIAGEPIVETPRDALLCLCYTGLDCCQIGGWIVTKDYERQPLSDCVIVLNTLWYGLFGLDGYPAEPSIIPSMQDISEDVMSVHISRISELALNSVHLRLATRKPWGDVVHGISAGFIRILNLIDGHSTTDRIFFALSADSSLPDSNSYTMTRFMRQLAVLRRLGAIDFVQANGSQASLHEPANNSRQL